MDPTKEAFLLSLGYRAWESGQTAAQYLHTESITITNADATVVHAGWIEARNLWQSNCSYLYN